MAEDAKQALKDEAGDDLDGPNYGPSRKSSKKELIPKDELDDDEDDNVPLSLSKARKKKPSISPKVKKQETEDGEDEKHLIKKKEVSKKISKTKTVKRKLESKEEEDEKPHKSTKRKRIEEKVLVKKVKITSVSLKKGKNETKQKKVYELPGQKHDPPDMRDPLRIFYETLYEKVPTSEMAATWLMERGLLPLEDARKVHEKKLRKHHLQKFGSPAKVTPAKKSSATSVKKEVKVASKTTAKKVKKKLGDSEEDEDDNDNDFDFIKKKPGDKKKPSDKKKSGTGKPST